MSSKNIIIIHNLHNGVNIYNRYCNPHENNRRTCNMKNIRKKLSLFIILAVLLLSLSNMKVRCYADETNIVIHGVITETVNN